MTNEPKITGMRVACLLAASVGLFALANGGWMITRPLIWYGRVPGVAESGYFNQHFIRDIGFIYILIGSAFLAGIIRANARAALWGVATLWLAAHAAFHIWEVVVGLCGPDALARDFVGVTAPALVGIAITAIACRRPA